MEVAIAFYQTFVSCLRPLQVFAALALLSYLVSGVPSATALARALSLASLLAHCARALIGAHPQPLADTVRQAVACSRFIVRSREARPFS